jgi:hypothetical protein
VKRIRNNYNEEINKWSGDYEIPTVLIIATLAMESGVRSKARRKENGFISDKTTPGKVSVGLMQTLISTARATHQDKK